MHLSLIMLGTLASALCLVSMAQTNPMSIETCLQDDKSGGRAIPEITSKNGVIKVPENSTINLECDVKCIGEYVVLWRFKDVANVEKVLYTDRVAVLAVKYGPNMSISKLGNSHGLTIKNLTSELEGEYICEISKNVPEFIVYKVSIEKP